MYDLINVLEVFLPQLLRYPNPTDPLNTEAASLLLKDPSAYEAKVKDFVQRFASEEAATVQPPEDDEDDDDNDLGSIHSLGGDDDDDDDDEGEDEEDMTRGIELADY